MKRDFVLSVVIPTRNRAEFALAAIRQVLAVHDADLQLVIQDNSDDDSLRHMCGDSMSDPRFTYHYSPGVLSFVDNFNEAIGLAAGEYVTIIGDDDGINPEIMDAVRWARARGVRAIKPGLQAVYFWPNVGLSFTQAAGDTGLFIIEPVSGAAAVRRTRPQLKRLLGDGCQGYLERDLAKLYHGIVRRDALEELHSISGRYFGGLSPDIYAAVALSLVIDEVVCIDYPLTIPGVCPTSGSADSGTGRHTGRLRDAPHFKGHPDYRWSAEVPEFYSVETIWADSAMAAIREMRHPELLRAFKPQYLAAYSILHHAEYADLVREHYFALMQGRGVSDLRARQSLDLATLAIRIRGRIAREKLSRKKPEEGPTRLEGIGDISLAASELTRHLRGSGLSVNSCLAQLDSRFPQGEVGK